MAQIEAKKLAKLRSVSRVTVTIDGLLISPNPVVTTESAILVHQFAVAAIKTSILVKTATFTVSHYAVTTNGIVVATKALIFSATLPNHAKLARKITAPTAKTSSKQHNILRDPLNRITNQTRQTSTIH